MSEVIAAPAPATEPAYVAETELRAGALGFWGNMVQAVTHIAPGLNILLGLTFIVSFAGVAAPWAYIIGGIICLGVAVVLTQLAKEFTGPGGFNFSSFNPNNLPSVNGLYLGVVFTILALSGFEAVAPLAEETENPRRNLPIAIVGSVVVVAIFYALVNWGVLVGHGTTLVAQGKFTNSDQIFDLARSLWGGAWLFVLFATVNSALAVSIAIQNASTRVFFGMG